TDTSQRVLWAPRMLVFPGVSETENRERFWQQLYYLGYDEKKFWTEVDRSGWNFLAGMFPYQRLSPAVSGRNEHLTSAALQTQPLQKANLLLTYTLKSAAVHDVISHHCLTATSSDRETGSVTATCRCRRCCPRYRLLTPEYPA